MTQVQSDPDGLTRLHAALLADDLRELYEHAPCGYLSTTPEGVITRVNATFLRWTGYRSDELVGERRLVDLLTAGGRIFHETHYAPMLRMQGTVREVAFDLVCAGGHRLPVLVNAVAGRDEDGEVQTIRVAVFDATERRQYERELLLAKKRAEASEAEARRLVSTLQQVLIPPLPPEIPGLDLAAHYQPAGPGIDVGGDFYDVFEIGHGDWAVVMGDVCGKGVDAAVVASLARHTARAAAVRDVSPRRVLSVLSEVVLHHQTDRFCTAGMLRLADKGGHWVATSSSGGHPPPVLVRPGRRPELIGRTGTLLGMFPDPVLHDDRIELQSGDGIVLYTDGVTEARRGRELFGEERLLAALSQPGDSARAVVDELVAQVRDFQAGPPTDDIAVLMVRIP